VFWEQGYDCTSMADIVEATGLNKSSIYNTFGSKDDLYERAVDRYIDAKVAAMRSVLLDGSQGLDDVRRLLALVRREAETDAGRRGCLAVNMTTELGLRVEFAQAAARRFRESMRDGFAAALRRAAAAGEIEAANIDAYLSVLMLSMFGLPVIARGGAALDEQMALVSGVEAVVEGWRVDSG
jgi:TetR/AcrR family transcriptional repressor of nem operon